MRDERKGTREGRAAGCGVPSVLGVLAAGRAARRWWLLVLGLLCAPLVAGAQSDASKPRERGSSGGGAILAAQREAPSQRELLPELTRLPILRPPPGRERALVAVRTSQAPVIDGLLSETVWARAAVAESFWLSRRDRAPSEPTQALVLFDDQWLYIGFRVFDRMPDQIEAQQVRRDAGLGYDDAVTVEIDANRNFRELSKFSVSARGTQYDELAGGRASRIDWKGDWRAAAARTAYGWSVELAIPFDMLDYPEGARSFGINFVRYHHRTGERSYWADVTPQFKPEEMGRLTGLALPSPARSRWTIMPYALVGTHVPDRRGRIRDRFATAGADLRYQAGGESTALLSVNPDFTQIESQFATINFSYTEKAVAEVRPFFQEGATYFDAGRDNLYFYSNRVPNIEAGARYFGRSHGTQFAGFMTSAPDGREDYALRVLRELDPTNSAALSIYGTRRAALDNRVVVGQVNGRQRSGFSYSADVAGASTDGGTHDATHLRGVLGWNWDYHYVSAATDRYGARFLPANGLLPADLPGTRGTSASAGYYRVFGTGPLYAARLDFSLLRRETDAGQLQNGNSAVGGYVELENQLRAGLYLNSGRYRPVTLTPGVFSAAINRDHTVNATLDFNTRSAWIGYGLAYASGRLGGGDYRFLPAYLWLRPWPELYLSASVEVLRSFERFEQSIFIAKWDITPVDALGVRLVRQGDRDFKRLTYARQVRSGMDVFAVLDQSPGQPTQLSVKFLLTWR